MFLDDQSYTHFCGLSTFDDKMFLQTDRRLDTIQPFSIPLSHSPVQAKLTGKAVTIFYSQVIRIFSMTSTDFYQF